MNRYFTHVRKISTTQYEVCYKLQNKKKSAKAGDSIDAIIRHHY